MREWSVIRDSKLGRFLPCSLVLVAGAAAEAQPEPPAQPPAESDANLPNVVIGAAVEVIPYSSATVRLTDELGVSRDVDSSTTMTLGVMPSIDYCGSARFATCVGFGLPVRFPTWEGSEMTEIDLGADRSTSCCLAERRRLGAAGLGGILDDRGQGGG